MANLSTSLSDLKKHRAAAQSDIARIDQALAALTGAGRSPGARGKKRGRKRAPAVGKKRKRKGMSKAARLAVSRKMKKYWAERKKKGKKN